MLSTEADTSEPDMQRLTSCHHDLVQTCSVRLTVKHPHGLVDVVCRDWAQVYLVGDPVQLPATVISKRAVAHGYDVSLFKRLQSAGYPVQILDMQYRMHPNICKFPSDEFYQGALKTGEGVEDATARPWHEHKVRLDLGCSMRGCSTARKGWTESW